MTHIPILRAGKPYKSLDAAQIRHVETGEIYAEASQANPGLIARDMLKASDRKRAMERIPIAEMLDICKRAARVFMEDALPIGDETQTPDDYVRQTSASTGLPQTLCRLNMEKIRHNLDKMETILGGLTRGLNLRIIENGWGVQDGRRLSYAPQTDALGAVLPSNSPGVHSLWLPAVALRVPVVLKPGSGDPWTPYRIAQALMKAGCPAEAFSFYPSSHNGANEILVRTGSSMLFGGADTVRPWRTDPRVQIHGPGWSKVLFGEDAADGWRAHLDMLEYSVADNGGRSCVNASGVWTPSRAREMAEALAKRLAQIEARPLDDPDARIAAFANPRAAQAVSDMIDAGLKTGGAVDLTAQFRKGRRFVQIGNCGYVQPTVVYCESFDHPLAKMELLLPFVSVVQVPQAEMLARIGPTLSAAVVTEDAEWMRELMSAPHIERLSFGSIPTNRVAWDQPHEGNLFERLYRQRAFQASA